MRSLNPDCLISDLWRAHAAETPEHVVIVHYAEGTATHRWTWKQLFERSDEYTARLREARIRRGDVCALIVRHHGDFYPLYLAILELGAIPAVLAYPNPRLHPEKFRDGLRGMARVSGLDWVLTEADLRSVVTPILCETGSTVRGVLLPFESEELVTGFRAGGGNAQDATRRSPDDPCLLQHSSGTTGLQKGVMLSHRAVATHVQRYGSSIELGRDDRVVSWLPLYHDMGLIAAFHLPLALNVTTVMIDPFEWVAAPDLFLHAISRENGTVSWLPNFAYSLMAARVRDEDLPGIRLESIRLLVNCSEPVRGESHDAFAARFAPYGLSRTALGASYAMAEATFAVTQTPLGKEARRVEASRSQLAAGVYDAAAHGEPSRTCVSSGSTIPGCFVRVVDNSGADLDDGRIGELWIRSESLFSGYRNDPLSTARCFNNGWYATGDYGFVLDGDLFVVGRKKDLIIVAGKNIYPEDVESAANDVAGVLPGRVIAFGRDDIAAGTERIWVVAETPEKEAEARDAIRRAIVAEAMRLDVTVSEVVLVEPRWLIKSSAGKPSRSANKERIEALIADRVEE